MKRNKFMFLSGLLLTIGSTAILPVVGVGGSFLLGNDFEKLWNSSPIIPIVGIGAMVLIPIVGVLLITGSVLIPLFSSMRSNSKIIEQGKDAEAKILALADTGTRINNNPLVNFTLEVHPQMSSPFQAVVSQTVSVIHLPSYQPGKIVNVKYMPGTNEVTIIGAKFV
jgi:hypothetical protein